MITVNASSLDRIMNCAGSVELVRLSPKPDAQDISEEGSAAHDVAAKLFTGQAVKEGDKAANGWVITGEMLDDARTYVNRFASDLPKRVETKANWGIPDVFEVRNRGDLTIWHEAQRTLAVVDFKYGFRWVAAEWNYQLIAGAIGTAIGLGVVPEKFILAIYQPRAGGEPLRSWEATPGDMMEAYNRIVARLSNLTDALQTGAHCRYCPALGGCPAAQRAGYNAVDVAMNASAVAIDEAGMRAELDVLDRAAETLKQRIKWIEGHCLDAFRSGRRVPGLSTAPQLGNTTWRPEIGVEDLRRMANGTNQTYLDEVPITPAEAKRRGMADADYARLTYRPDRGMKLQRKDGAELAAKAFADPPNGKKPRKKKGDA